MFLKANKIGLRQLEREDLPQLRDWRNSLEIRAKTREFAPLNMLNQERWRQTLVDKRDIMFGICLLENYDEKLIGVNGIVHIDWKNRSGEYSIYIGEENCRGKGYSRESDYLAFRYAL